MLARNSDLARLAAAALRVGRPQFDGAGFDQLFQVLSIAIQFGLCPATFLDLELQSGVGAVAGLVVAHDAA
jgi:hypothetical protein